MFLLAATSEAQQPPACVVKGEGFSFDLSSIAGKKFLWTDSFQPPVFEYFFVPCGQSDCGGVEGSSCQISLNYPPQTVLFNWDGSATWQKTDYGASTTFANGATCNGSPRVSHVNLVCSNETRLVSVTEPPNGPCHYIYTFNVDSELCRPYDGTCKSVHDENECAGVKSKGGMCHWCSGPVPGCFEDAEARALPPKEFSCSWCEGVHNPEACGASRGGGAEAEACKWCVRADGGTPGACVNSSTASQLPHSIFNCSSPKKPY